MPKLAKELAPLTVSRLPPGRHPVGGVPGLYLLVEPNRSRRWLLRVMISGKRQDLGLGGYPGVTLGQARVSARELRLKVMEGKDPGHERRVAKLALKDTKSKERTFRQCAEDLIESLRHGWENAKHAAQWASTLQHYAYPEIGDRPVQEVTSAQVLRILQPIWHTKTETASRLRGRIEKVFSMAMAQGYRTGENPARWKDLLEHSLPPVSKTKTVTHFASMAYEEMSDFLPRLRKREGIAARAVEFLILTLVRPGEVRGTRWDEINLKTGIWTIPARRMKTRREHRVPLTLAAMELLMALPRTSELTFPSPLKGKKISDMTMTAVLRRMDIPEDTVHGFRTSFRTWSAEQTNFPREVCEAVLAHINADPVEAAYLRTDLFEKRKQLMALWEQHINSSDSDKVISITRGKRNDPEK